MLQYFLDRYTFKAVPHNIPDHEPQSQVDAQVLLVPVASDRTEPWEPWAIRAPATVPLQLLELGIYRWKIALFVFLKSSEIW